jgi:aconitate hydratase A / 2-methylisocitrate dehydratase
MSNGKRVSGKNSLNTASTLTVGDETVHYHSLPALASQGWGELDKLPFSLKVLLENLLRFEDGDTVTLDDIRALVKWSETRTSDREIAYRPARVLMQDFTGVPGVVDLAAMRDAISAAGGDPNRINPLTPVDLVIDHSVMVDKFGQPTSFSDNVEAEYQRNRERYEFLRWGQQAFENFRVVPPGTGICHQVNLEYLAKGVWSADIDGQRWAYPDTLVGTDSHTTMINGLGVLGWGVGGIEAEAAMLGQPISMLIPEVIGFKMVGALNEGITATDLVLTVTEMLRKHGVVGKFVEFYGDGLADLTLADRATIANMAPEYGATCGFFPIDARTIEYLTLSGRDDDTIALVEAYCKAQGLWREPGHPDPVFTDSLTLDLTNVFPSLAGPKRPQDRVLLSNIPEVFLNVQREQAPNQDVSEMQSEGGAQAAVGAHPRAENNADVMVTLNGAKHRLSHGDVVIAAITSCTNTSNPSVMLAAGLLAQNARKKGLETKPWVKTSLAPGSKVVTDYLAKAGVQDDLNALGFDLVGYGCTTCIGNSGPLPEEIERGIQTGDLIVASVLSGNRNFEGRVHQSVKTNWLASPPLVVAYALAGSVKINLSTDSLGKGSDGDPVYLKDIWPSNTDIQKALQSVNREMFRKQYASVFSGDEQWQALPTSSAKTYRWKKDSTYIQHPPFFDGLTKSAPEIKPIIGAHILALLGDSITTDHISPAGNIKADSPAGHYLQGHGVEPRDFNSYGSRRGNHEVMMRGTFANIRIRNEMVPGVEGGFTKHMPQGETLPIYGAAMRYLKDEIPTVVIAGKEYGTGSSRDWAAKGTNLLGVKAVIAESFERIHRSNLIGMGVLPLQFNSGDNRNTLKLTGAERIDVPTLSAEIKPGDTVEVVIHAENGDKQRIKTTCRLDTATEVQYFRNGGILHYVLRSMM